MLTILTENKAAIGNNMNFTRFRLHEFYHLPDFKKHMQQAPREALTDTKNREAARRIRHVRARLAASAGGKISYSYELLILYASNQLKMALGIPVLAVILALSSLIWIPAGRIAIWLAAVLFAQFVLLYYCKQLVKLPEHEVKASIWGRKLTAAEFLIGISWAVLIGLLWHPTSAGNHIYIMALVVIIISIRTMLASHSLPIVYAGIFPLVLTVSIMFVLEGDILHLSLAGVVIATGIFYIVLAHMAHGTARTMIEFRTQKDALIAELEEARLNSDEARRHAEDANLAKSRFLATMSHELRTPLNAIMGFADIMNREMFGAHNVAAYKEYSRDIYQSGDHLLKLINEILDLSRIEAGRYNMAERNISLSYLGAECMRLMQLRARKRGVELLAQFEPGLPEIYADEKAIRQIWLNLASNSIKFTPSGGQVLFATRRENGGCVSLVVRDTGVGIAADEVEQILSPFNQGAIARVQAEEGAGLGLPIVRGLAELHGARLSIRSRIRMGTEIAIIFPPERVLNNSIEKPVYSDEADELLASA